MTGIGFNPVPRCRAESTTAARGPGPPRCICGARATGRSYADCPRKRGDRQGVPGLGRSEGGGYVGRLVLLPLGDSPNPVGFRPWVNWALIATNVCVFVLLTLPLSATGVDPQDPRALDYLRSLMNELPAGARASLEQLTAYEIFVFEHGFKPGAPELSDLFSSLFLHGGFMHLAGNMLFLWIYGDNVEHRLGRATYLLVYLGTGVVATLTFAMFAPTSTVPLVGASGAISGVLGLYFLMFPRNMVKVFVGLFPFFFDIFWIRARWVLGFYVVIDNILPFVIGAQSNVAYGAHLGGFFAGLGIAWWVESRGGKRPDWRRPKTIDQAPPPSTPFKPEVQTLQDAARDGDLSRAVRAAADLEPEQIAELPARDLYTVARGLAESGRDDLAGRALRRALYRQRGRPSGDAAVLHLALGELRLAQGQPTSAYQHLLTVLDLAPASREATRARAALAALAQEGSVTNRW